MQLLEMRTDYSLAERRSDAVIHAAGLIGVAIGVPVLLGIAIHLAAPRRIILGASIYGAALLAMIGFSALYNTVGQYRWQPLLKRLDHAAIYIKIAASYTVFALFPESHAGHLVSTIWALATAGVAIKLIAPERLPRLTLGLYLAMGWIGALLGEAMFDHLSTSVFALIVVAGLTYSVGVIFYLFERLPFHYTIWHVLVLLGSICIYAAVTVQLVQAA